MSRGLGSTERLVLTILKRFRCIGYKPEVPVYFIADMLLDHDVDKLGWQSHYKSVCRAVKSLERKNYVKTKFQNINIKKRKTKYNPHINRTIRYKILMIGPRMYEEEQWLHWYKRFDVDSR